MFNSYLAIDSPPYSADKIPRQLSLPASAAAVPSQEIRHTLQSYLNHTSHPSLLRLVDTSSAVNLLHTNCSLPSKTDNCSFVQLEAILNLADRTVCRCADTRLSVGSRCVSQRMREGRWEPGPSLLGAWACRMAAPHDRFSAKFWRKVAWMRSPQR